MTVGEVGSPGDLRVLNEERILQFVREYPRSTQLAIARGVGLTRAAVAKLIGTAPDNGKAPTNLRRVLDITEGRPGQVSVRADLAVVLALDIGSKHIRVGRADLSGNPVHVEESDRRIDVVSEPARALDEAAALIERSLEGYRRDALAGIAVGVPFPVRRDGVVLAPGEWRYFQLPTSLWQRLGWASAAVVRSDADLGAIAELEAALRDPGIRGLSRDKTDVVYTKWSSAVTGAIVTGGTLHRGYGGIAGQFAHSPVTGAAAAETKEFPLCKQCGKRCLTAVASLNAIVGALDPEHRAAADLEERDAEERAKVLVARAREGDEACQRLLVSAARALGAALGAVINVVNPRLVIIGGAFQPSEYGYLARSLHEGVEETAFPVALNDALLQTGRCTGSAAVVGGIALALREFAVRYLRDLSRNGREVESARVG